ncbi:MAG: MATE family efflux transporter [Eubacteriales bacterium]|nr:MATE family efflux transporter [Eubacteriales bacterium]
MKKQNIGAKIVTFVLPIAVQNLLASLVSVSDTLMLGMVSQNVLSAVSLATQVTFVLNLFFSALTVGTTILAAQYWGKCDLVAVERILGIAVRISCLISAVFFLASQLCPQFLMGIFTDDGELIRTGAGYLRIAGLSHLLMAVPQIYLCIMKNSGRMLKSTIYGFVAVAANIVLNGIFIFGLFGFPEMGAAGAAAATDLAIGAELCLVLYENMTTDTVRIRWRYLRSLDIELLKDFFKYTLPVLADLLVWGLGFTTFSVILGHMGNDAVAANSIANTAKNIISCFCLGLGSGTGIIVGNELGQNHLDTAREYGNKLLHISVWLGIGSGAALVLMTPLFLGIVSSLNDCSSQYLKWMMLICGFYMAGKSVNVTLIDGVFCAGGDTRFGLWCDIVILWLIVIPLGALSAFVFKCPAPFVYLILSLDELLKLPAVYLHYKKYKWVRNLT